MFARSGAAVCALASLALTFAAPARAQFLEFCDDFTKPACAQRNPWEERIETERHDFTQSAVTVGRGVAQIEGGYTYFYNKDGGETESAHTTPEMLLRWGVSEDIEVRLRWNYVWQFIEDEPGRTGSEDTAADRFTMFTQSAVLGLELSEANTMYAEWFGIYSNGLEDEFAISVYNVGVDHYVTDDFVLDVRVGVGLSDDADDFFSGVGGGYRF